MNLEESLCNAFCQELVVRKVPAGYAVGTGYDGPDNDPLGFYVVGPDADARYRIQDDGMSLSSLEARGASLSGETRQAILNALFKEYGVRLNADTSELTTESIPEAEIPHAALRFIAFMLRVQDILFLSQERTANTFREDVMAKLESVVGSNATIVEDHIIHDSLKDFPAEIALISEGRPPVALFLGRSNDHVNEALLLHAFACQANVRCKVIALLETENSVSKRTRQRATNRLAALPYFRGDEQAACERILREVIPEQQVFH